MDPVTLIVDPGFLGGLVIALIFVRLHRGRDAGDLLKVCVTSGC